MDKLTLADQQKVRKMLDERLRAKLVDAGYEKYDLDLTEREDLLTLYAELLAQTQARVSVSKQETTVMGDILPPDGRVSGNPALDREMFEFNKRKWEAEERYREFQMKRWEAEERRKDAEREERDRKWEAEREERRAELEERRAAREAEMKLKEAELGTKKEKAAKQDTNVGKRKIFSDAMRSSAIHISDDPIEAVAFFMNVEQLFDVYKVPTDLRALLIRPYLNDKANSIVSKLTPDVAGDYSRLKDALLHEFKLSPNTYLERFNSCRKSGAETFVAFASRLKVC